jgi:two-component system sensor histidine kinase/response regulator
MDFSEPLTETQNLKQETEIAILYEIATMAKRLHSLDTIVNLALDKAFHLLGSEIVVFYLYNGQEKRLQARASLGVRLNHICNEISLSQEWSETMAVIRTWMTPQPSPFPKNPLLGMYPVKAALGVPVQGDSGLLGWLYAARVKPRAYTRSEVSLYNVLANQVATTLEITIAWEKNQQQQHVLTAANQQLRQALTEIEQRTVKLIRTTREAQRARESAEAANRAKSVFLANVSHELRTPLNAILGFTQLMTRDAGMTSEQHESLDIISRSGEHLLNLINDVLEMSKIEAGRTNLHEQSFDLARLLQDLEDMFHLRATEKGVLLIFEQAPDVPQYIQADEGKLRQVLINLLSNAIKFTHKGSILLRVRTDMQENQEHQEQRMPRKRRLVPVVFEVQDSGVGIGEEEIPNLFEEFVQTRSGQQAQEGTGLGLPISRHFVRLMGGDLTVHSKVGRGSTFLFTLPLKLAENTDVQDDYPTSRAIGLAQDQPSYRILVVEDDWTNRKLLARLLQSVGFDVREAINGQEAIDIWQHWTPHLIWMDMRMPVLDGYEATRHIKSTSDGQSTIIIALTASAFEEQRTLALAAGCNDFVRKPFRQALVLDKMGEHLGVRFVYEDDVEHVASDAMSAEPRQDVSSDEEYMNDTLSNLPPLLVAQLHHAASLADIDMIGTIIDQVRQHNSMLADILTDLAHNFRLDQIMEWTKDGAGLHTSSHQSCKENEL